MVPLCSAAETQKECPSQDKGVKMVDAPRRRDGEDSTAGKSNSSSDQYQPPMETTVSLTTVCVVSAVAQILHLSQLHTHTSVCLTLSHFLTHLLSAYVHINFSLPDTHNALLAGIHTLTDTHMYLHTPTLTFLDRQNMKEESSRN